MLISSPEPEPSHSQFDLLLESLRKQTQEQIEKLFSGKGLLSLTPSKAKKTLEKFAAGSLDTILAFVDHNLPTYPAMTAAVIGSFHLGSIHKHALPPFPLPSFGRLRFGGCASVLIDSHPAARLGDIGLAPTCGSITPFYKVMTGSASVFIGGSRAVRLGDFTRACGTTELDIKAFAALKSNALLKTIELGIDAIADRENPHLAEKVAVATSQVVLDLARDAIKPLVGVDPGTPPCLGVMLPIRGTVDIGGWPCPDSGEILKGAPAFTKGLAKNLTAVVRDAHRSSKLDRILTGNFRKGRASNSLPSSQTILTGHPVDVVSGSFVLDATDAELPGALPLRLTRSYSSTWGSRPSPCGHGWSHSLDEAVWREPGQLVYRAHDGRELELPLPDLTRETFFPRHRLTVRSLPDGTIQLDTHDGLLRDFAPLDDQPSRPSPLLKIHDRRGHRIDLEYRNSRLTRAHTPDGRELRFHYHPDGHLAQIDLPDPAPGSDGFLPHIHYTYDGDDLTSITDALGHVTRYRLDNHKIIEETLPNGLRFHFEYDGRDTDAACTRTRGDGGIIDHSLIYDRPRRTTLVTNSSKEPRVIRFGAHGEPLTITDARGAVTRHEYDEHLRRTATIDPLGRETRHTYDARGNCTRTVAPDGATTTVEYDRDLPAAATDPAGGRWRWSHDARGRLVRRTDPLGRTTTYQYSNDDRTTTVTHPDGRRELRTHDLAGRLVRVELPDGRALQHTYDRRGRLVRTVHPDGTIESHAHDLLNRHTRHTLGSDTRHFNYDDLGNLVRACDARTDLRCTYTGLRWLASVGDANTSPVTIERDLEGRILRVADATGTLLHAERDATGRPRAITDPRGRRRLTRDLAGQVLASTLDARITTFTRDLAGRVTRIDHPDRSHDEFNYRPDGALLSATRRTADTSLTIRRELDACARILREWQDDRWVALSHDLHDRLTHLRSSSGADIRFHHDDRGLARITLPSSTWSMTSERDPHGRELARQLPAGLNSWWHRDAAGRPVEHGITASRPPQIHRHRRYTWTPDGHLAGETDQLARPRLRTTTTPESITCSKDQADTVDPLGRPTTRGDARWQWCGDLLVHTHASTTHTWIFDPSRTPLACLSTSTHHSILATPTGTLATYDASAAAALLPHDLPPAPQRLDIFGRPHVDSPALALLTAELAPDLPETHPHSQSRESAVLAPDLPETHPPAGSRESAVLAAVFRTPLAP